MTTPSGSKLPSVALGDPNLLKLERGLVLFLALLCITTVVVRAFQGRLPSGIPLPGGQATYDPIDAEITTTTTATLKELKQGLESIEARQRLLAREQSNTATLISELADSTQAHLQKIVHDQDADETPGPVS